MNPVPSLIVDGEGQEQWGLAIDAGGFLIPMQRPDKMAIWEEASRFPPKLAGYVDVFIAQHYHALNNQYGNPQPKKV